MKRYQINTAQIEYEVTPDEVVISKIETGEQYALYHAGVDIWALVEAHAPVEAMVEALVARYVANAATLAGAIEQLLADMEQAGLIMEIVAPQRSGPALPLTPLLALEKLPFVPPQLARLGRSPAPGAWRLLDDE